MKRIWFPLALLLAVTLPLVACEDPPDDYYYNGDIFFDDSSRPGDGEDEIGDNHPTDLPYLPV